MRLVLSLFLLVVSATDLAAQAHAHADASLRIPDVLHIEVLPPERAAPAGEGEVAVVSVSANRGWRLVTQIDRAAGPKVLGVPTPTGPAEDGVIAAPNGRAVRPPLIRARRDGAASAAAYVDAGPGPVELASGDAGGGIRLRVELRRRPGDPPIAQLARRLRFQLLPR